MIIKHHTSVQKKERANSYLKWVALPILIIGVIVLIITKPFSRNESSHVFNDDVFTVIADAENTDGDFFILDSFQVGGAAFQTDEFAFPNFYLETLDDEKIFLNEQDLPSTGLLNVWASWCITCLVEHPFLMNLKEKDIKIIGLNYKDERFNAQNWLNKYGDPYSEVLYDPKGSLALDLGVTGAPETFLIHNGKIIAHYYGEVNERV